VTAPDSRRRDAPAEATVVMKAFRSWAAAAEWAFECPVGPGKVDGFHRTREGRGGMQAIALINNWLRVLGTAELAQIDQGVCQQLHAIMPLLYTFKS
jgi:hypothetical protein